MRDKEMNSSSERKKNSLFFARTNSNLRGSTLALLFVMILLGSFMQVFLIGAANGETTEQPRYGGVLVIGSKAEPKTLLPLIGGSATGGPAAEVFSTLVRYDFDLNVYPSLAESWDISDDGLTYTFHLVRNATWHDGVPFTSEDVKFTAPLILEYAGEDMWADITIETPDPYTVVFKLSKTYPLFMKYLSGKNRASILPKHIYDGTNILENPNNWEPIGTGAFMFKEWVPGDHITFVRNPNYFVEGTPYLDEVIWKFIPDPSTRLYALDKGEIDFMNHMSAPKLGDAEVEAMNNVYVVHTGKDATSTQMGYFKINLRNPPLDNKTVRKALFHAIDIDPIIERAYYGRAIPATGPFANIPSAYPNPEIEPYKYNVTLANLLLDDAGYLPGANGIRFKLEAVMDVGDGAAVKYGEILKEQWKEVGIDLVLVALESGAYKSKIGSFEFDFEFRSTASTGPEPVAHVESKFLSSKIISGAWQGNIMGYNNSRVDEIIYALMTEVDVEKREELYHEMYAIIWDELPIISLVEYDAICLARTEFVGFAQAASSHYESHHLVYWTEGELPPSPTPPDGELEEKVDALDSAVKSLTSQISGLDSKISGIETSISDISDPITPNMTISYMAVIIALVAVGLSIYFRKQM